LGSFILLPPKLSFAMKTLICRLAAPVLLFTCLLATECNAQWPYGGFGVGYGFPIGAGGYYGYRGNIPTPPYFAIHPPVFYGERVERPYGISPFAALPPMHSELVKAKPAPIKAMIANPYIEESVEAIPAVNQVSQIPKPTIIVNPYVLDKSTLARTIR
jgi:hypothetical protein